MALAFAVAASAGPTPAADGSAREISEVERAAVQLSVEYLAGGPEAVLRSLATGSRLKKMPAAHAAAEIEVRLGPSAEASWKLQTVERRICESTAAFEINFPSGIDELVLMDFIKEGSQLKLAELRILAEPVSTPEKQKELTSIRTVKVAALALILMGVATPVARKKKSGGKGRSILISAAVVLLLTAAAGIWIFTNARRKSVTKAPVVAVETGGLRTLLPLRRALTRGPAMARCTQRVCPPLDLLEMWPTCGLPRSIFRRCVFPRLRKRWPDSPRRPAFLSRRSSGAV